MTILRLEQSSITVNFLSSLLFTKSVIRTIIVGDAVPLEGNFKEIKAPTLNTDPKAALQGIKGIRMYADVVIPEHGFPLMAD